MQFHDTTLIAENNIAAWRSEKCYIVRNWKVLPDNFKKDWCPSALFELWNDLISILLVQLTSNCIIRLPGSSPKYFVGKMNRPEISGESFSSSSLHLSIPRIVLWSTCLPQHCMKFSFLPFLSYAFLGSCFTLIPTSFSKGIASPSCWNRYEPSVSSCGIVKSPQVISSLWK